ncbi:MAG: hypothetical protein AAGK22_04770 [Acidobacteriota bacterium]
MKVLDASDAAVAEFDVNAPAGTFFLRPNGRLALGAERSSPSSFGPSGDIEVRGDDSSSLYLTSYNGANGSYPRTVLRMSRGSEVSSTAIEDNGYLGFYGFAGYEGGGFSGIRSGLASRANEGWAPGSNGTKLQFFTTTNGTSSMSVRMTLDHEGSLGIGTTSPSEKLHVANGNIRVQNGHFIENTTELDVPDFVFDPSYELMPLATLAQYVQDERHLPEIPSAKEMAREGMKLGELQLKLLQKIEELTLHTIRQQEEIDSLREALEGGE